MPEIDRFEFDRLIVRKRSGGSLSIVILDYVANQDQSVLLTPAKYRAFKKWLGLRIKKEKLE